MTYEERYDRYFNPDRSDYTGSFDNIILDISTGFLKCGKFSKDINAKPKFKIKNKELFPMNDDQKIKPNPNNDRKTLGKLADKIKEESKITSESKSDTSEKIEYITE